MNTKSLSRKQQFLQRKAIRSLSPEEQERRWQQHLNSSAPQGRKTQKQNPPRLVGAKTRKNPQPRSRKSQLSDCSIYYALALSDPWDCPAAPCIPDNITLESWKFGVRARGNGVVGLNGVGYVAINPFNPYALSIGQTISGIVTDATYNSTGYSANVPGSVAIATDATQPYTNADNLEQGYRVVGSGLKVCYAGNEMNRQGIWTLARDPSNSPLVSGTTVNTLLGFRETVAIPVDKEWHAVLYKPATASDLTYAPRGLDIDGTAASPKLYFSYPSLVAMLSGGTPGASFQYDCITWFEMTGRGLPALTISESDPIGLSVASSAVSSHQPESSPQANAIAFAKSMDSHASNFSFIDFIGSAVDKIAPIVEQAAPYVLSMML